VSTQRGSIVRTNVPLTRYRNPLTLQREQRFRVVNGNDSLSDPASLIARKDTLFKLWMSTVGGVMGVMGMMGDCPEIR
jgi:hypothetical protein